MLQAFLNEFLNEGVIDEGSCDFHIGKRPHYGELILKSLNYYELFRNKPNRNASPYIGLTPIPLHLKSD